MSKPFPGQNPARQPLSLRSQNPLQPSSRATAPPAPEPVSNEPVFRLSSDLGQPQTRKLSRGPEVTLLQSVLQQMGFKVTLTGVFDMNTFAAVRLLQSKYRLPPTGIVEGRTRALLNQRLINFEEETLLIQYQLESLCAYRLERRLPANEIWLLWFEHVLRELIARIDQLAQLAGAPPRPQRPSQPLIESVLGSPGEPGVVTFGPEVFVLQEFLISLGLPLSANQSFDLQTYTALRQYQARSGLPPTGITDGKTRQAVNHALQQRYAAGRMVLHMLEELAELTAKRGRLWTYAFETLARSQIEQMFTREKLPPLTQELGPAQRAGKVSKGVEVVLCQHALNLAGLPVPISGEFDAPTQEATRKLQKQLGHPTTGLIDQKLREYLNMSYLVR